MKKGVFGKQLSRERGSRKALFRGLVKALVENGSITTTRAKARAVVPLIDNLINLAKRNSLDSIRKIYAKLGNDRATSEKIVKEIAPNLKKRSSGFTKITKLPRRRGDNAEVVKLEWVKEEKPNKKKGKRK